MLECGVIATAIAPIGVFTFRWRESCDAAQQLRETVFVSFFRKTLRKSVNDLKIR